MGAPPRALVTEKKVIICAGPGGVGKTTTSAALAVLGARTGRRTLVATIDPAPRLVDALALPDLGPSPAAIPEATARALGITGPGALLAARIDPETAFASLVAACTDDEARRARILGNTIYRNMTSTLTGAQEYAATLALQEFVARGQFDLVVVDTPPASNALEFFDAPQRLAAAVDGPVIKWLLSGRGAGRLFSIRRLSAGSALIFRGLAKLVGSAFLDDLAAFFADFEPVLGGFVAQSQATQSLLRQPDVATILVSAPDTPTIDESLGFAERMAAIGLPPQAFIINRELPPPGLLEEDALADALAREPSLEDLPRETLDDAAAALHRAAETLARAGENQAHEQARLRAAHPHTPIVGIPLVEVGEDSLDVLRATLPHLG